MLSLNIKKSYKLLCKAISCMISTIFQSFTSYVRRLQTNGESFVKTKSRVNVNQNIQEGNVNLVITFYPRPPLIKIPVTTFLRLDYIRLFLDVLHFDIINCFALNPLIDCDVVYPKNVFVAIKILISRCIRLASVYKCNSMLEM